MRNILTIGLLFSLQLAGMAQPMQTQVLQGHVPTAAARLTPAGHLDANRELKLAIGLPLRDKKGLTNLLQRIYDPASPDYHHYLTAAQFAERFGPTEQDYQAVTAFAVASGLKVTATHPNRALLDVTGSVANIEKAFHLTLRTYSHPREEREFYAPDVEPRLNLGTPVLHIGGLDNYLLPHPMSLKMTPLSPGARLGDIDGSGPSSTFMGNDFRAAYAPGITLDGAGQTVGLLEFDGYYPSDITNYAAIAGIPAVPLKNVYLDGFDGTPGYANDEVALDIDMAICMAPGLSSVIVYEAGPYGVTDDMLNRMATDNVAAQISSSWSYSIDAESEQIFQQFAAQGQSFFNASGDSDAYLPGQIYTPCDDPNITIVGGTTLTTSGPGGSWVAETVWNWDVEYGTSYDGIGGSGGISSTYAIPSWQAPVSMALNQGSASWRNIPDVAFTADNIFLVANDGAIGEVGGTSCATPLWAGFIALANQQAAASGRPPLGFINPAIYAIGLSAAYTNGFRDITNGNNTWSESPSNFFAVSGYDLCTGWGTPNGSNLVNLLAPPDPLQISPSGGVAFAGGVGGPLTPASWSFTLTNGGSTALNWSAGLSVAGSTAHWLNVSPVSGALSPGGSAAAVVVSLNAAASNLFLGTYGATVEFTNLSDGSIQSRLFTLSIVKPPSITAQPASLTLIGGMTATFTATASGGLPLNCQWQLNGTNVTNGGRISILKTTPSGAGGFYGSITNILTISNVAASDGGTYTLVASNAAGVAVSSGAVLAVTPSAPVIVQQPVSQSVLVGATVQMAVVADGTPPFSYQWQLNATTLTNGGAISGSASPTLTINGASSADIGTYTVLVSNSIGATASTGAVLQVSVVEPGVQLVQNGGFETGNFSSWTELGNFSDCSVSSSSISVHSGTYGALLGPPASLGYLSQTLPTTAGQNYLISLWVDSPDGLGPNEFLVAWNGTVLFDQVNIGAIGWTNLQFYAMATSTNTSLQIGFRDDTSFLGLDDVQVTPLAGANGPPVIATQPANQVGLVGGSATFSVVSAGQMPLFYLWQCDGTNIPNASGPTLVLTNLTTNEAGTYSVVVINSLGWAASSNAQLVVLTGNAETINFDVLSGSELPVPSGYGSLTWSNFYYLDAFTIGQPSGFVAGMVSPPNVAYNSDGAPAAILGSSPFDLLTAYLTAAWNDNLRLEVRGYAGATLFYDNTYTLSATAPTLITFNYLGVTSVQFISSGGTQHSGYSGSGLEFVMDNLTVMPTPTPPASTLYSFNGPDGGYPCAGLTQGNDGNFYGTTSYGGAYGYGTVFRMSTNGVMANLFSFNDTDGAYPCARLTLGSDGNFYGTASSGGTSGDGTVFKISTAGALTTLASFNYSDGAYPYGGVIQGGDGNFYGTTEYGGTGYYGTVFRMTPAGALSALASFNYSNGSYPYCALVEGYDGNFYGTTESGGSNGYGTAFKVTPSGGLITLVSFDDTDGAYPYAGLAMGTDGNFYGTTEQGGAGGGGTVFRITIGGIFTNLYSFDESVSAVGYYPVAGLIQGADGNFYGTTEYGGSFFNGSESVSANGTVFMITTNGTLTTLLALAGTNGSFPHASLVQGPDGNFYGTAEYGGQGFNGVQTSGDGTVFRIGNVTATAPPAVVAQPAAQIVPVNGTAVFSVTAEGAAPLGYSWLLNGVPIAGANAATYTTNNVQWPSASLQFSCVITNPYGSTTSSVAALLVFNGSGPLFSFNGQDGGYSYAALIQAANGNFYGTTEYGGTNGQGAVFCLSTNGVLSMLASFTDDLNGSSPKAALVQGSDGNFYGTTEYGGSNNYGTVFKMTPAGALTTLHSFDNADGYYPCAALVQGTDGGFYGTTSGGGSDSDGTVFRITASGAFTTLHSFDYSDGEFPCAALVQGADGSFYGTTEYGGAGYYGTVFKITTNGAFTNLVSFTGTDGSFPRGALIQGDDGNFYGTTSSGTNYYGTVFKMTTNGTVTTLLTFSYTNGSSPAAGLIQGADGYLYGTTSGGGSSGCGTIFKMTLAGALSNLFTLSGSNGISPQAPLLQGGDGNFYVTTMEGGAGFDGSTGSGNGTVFRVIGATGEPALVGTQPGAQTAVVGGSATFSLTAYGSTPISYFWYRNGVPIAGAANTNSYSNNNVQLSDNETMFSCLVSNAYGTNLSAAAELIVVKPTPELITFDDLSGSGLPVPSGYGGLNWSNFYYRNAKTVGTPSGFPAGMISVSNVACNASGANASISSATPFTLASAWLTAAWDDNLQVEVQGYNGVSLSYDNTYTLNPTAPALVAFNYTNVTSVQFIASGGFRHPGYASNGTMFVMDNVSVLSMLSPPAITLQPVSEIVLTNTTVSFTIAASGFSPLSYAWLRNGVPIPGAVAASYTTNNVQLADSGSLFSCMVSNACGTTLSSNAMLTVLTNGPFGAITNILVFNDNNSSSDFATALTGMNLPFQLFNSAQFANFTAATVAANPAASLVIVDSSEGSFNFTNVTAFVNTGGRALLCYWDLTSLPSLADAMSEFTTPQPVYNWGGSTLFSGVTAPLGFSDIVFVDGQFLQPAGTGAAVAGFVSSPATNQAAVIIGNSGQTILNGFLFSEISPAASGVQLASNEIQLILGGTASNAPPVIITQPASQAVLAGATVSFFVNALGSAPMNYYWLCNGTNITGATNSTFTINDVPLADYDIQFRCLASNAFGTNLSSNATLIVTLPSLVQNGGFETGSFADWTTGGNFEACDVTTNSLYVHSGQFGAQLGPVASPGFLSQTLATTAGQLYQVSCWLYCNGQTPNEFSVSWNGATVFDQANIGNTIWTNLQFQIAATGTETVLQFGFRNDAGYFGLDEVAAWPVIIQAPPAITGQSGSQTVLLNGAASISVTVSGAPPFTFQWQLNGTNLPDVFINTVAGGATAGPAGDGGAATNAELSTPEGAAVDAFGNLFIADAANNRIRKVAVGGVITTVAGTGAAGSLGDGGAATAAELNSPIAVTLDASGNLFIADAANNRVRKVGVNGLITTVAGNGTQGFSGDGGPATSAELYLPFGVAVDAFGNLFIADFHNSRIRKVGTNGLITTVAGTNVSGFSGDGSPAINAELHFPYDVALDPSGNLLIADYGNNRIRRVGTNGIITTVAGTNSGGSSGDGGVAVRAQLNSPAGVAVDASGGFFITDYGNNRVRRVGTNGIITTIAGNGHAGFSGDGGAATNAQMQHPLHPAVDAAGDLFFADSGNNRIREVVSPGPTLVLNNVGGANAGAYDLVVSNQYGSVTSSIMNLTVVLPPLSAVMAEGQGGQGVQLQFQGVSGVSYILLTSPALGPAAVWTPVFTNTADGSGNWTYTDTNPPSNVTRYYRISTTGH